jgi:cytochrome c-type biogenesis protein CcmH
LFGRDDDAHSEVDSEVAVLRDRRDEIERDRLAGRLSDADAAQATDELVDTLTKRIEAAPSSAVRNTESKRSLLTATLLACLIPISAYWVYSTVGNPSAGAYLAENGIDEAPSTQEVENMLAQIVQRTKDEPDNVDAWLVLAQARKIQGNNGAAAVAFEKAISLAEPDATILGEYAETLALAAQSDFSGKPTAVLKQAFELEPENVKVNALLGAALFRAGQQTQALPHLKRFLAALNPDSEQGRQIAQVVASIEGSTSEAPAASSTQPADPNAGKVTGSITLTGDAPPANATLFITARAPTGPRIPFAAIRLPVSEFPVQFELSDANAMSPSRLLSSAASVVIEARISQSGQAMRQSGDRFGTSKPVVPGNARVELSIDQIVQ